MSLPDNSIRYESRAIIVFDAERTPIGHGLGDDVTAHPDIEVRFFNTWVWGRTRRVKTGDLRLRALRQLGLEIAGGREENPTDRVAAVASLTARVRHRHRAESPFLALRWIMVAKARGVPS